MKAPSMHAVNMVRRIRDAQARALARKSPAEVIAYYRAAGVRGNKTTHSLRHTAITQVIMKSGSIQKAQSVARHKSVDTTMIYFHEIDRITNPGEAFIDYGEV